jgi:nucleoside phosphorylase
MERFGWYSARLLTVARAVVDAQRAQQLAEELEVEMVDMESRAILQCCIESELPCGVLRAISDRATAEAVSHYNENIAQAMRTLGRAVAELLTWWDERETHLRRARNA